MRPSRTSLHPRSRGSVLTRFGCSGAVGAILGLWFAWAHTPFDPFDTGVSVALGAVVFGLVTARSRHDYFS